MPVSNHATDVAIIGAGPVGLFAVFEAGMLEMSATVIDALDDLGGQCLALYPEKPIYDIPGHPKIAAVDLVERLRLQAAPFRPVYRLGQQVQSLDPEPEGGFILGTSAGERISARAVVIAAGGGAFGPNRPPLPRLAEFEGKSVFYMVRRREDFRGKRVVIAGGGDSAVDWALSLADVADSLYVVHRRPRFRAAPESERQMRSLAAEGRIELVIPYQLAGIEGTDGRLEAVVVRDLDGGERSLAADVLLPFYGLAMELGPIAGWGLNVTHNHIPIDPETCQTSIPGIFAIGDVATYPGKLKLILCGFSEAAMAMRAVYPLVHPGKALHFEYSTAKGVHGL